MDKIGDRKSFLVVICLNLLGSVRLFTSDRKWLVPMELASGSCVLFSMVNSYKTTLHNLN